MQPLRIATHGHLGPFDLVVDADGARSALRGPTGPVRRAEPSSGPDAELGG